MESRNSTVLQKHYSNIKFFTFFKLKAFFDFRSGFIDEIATGSNSDPGPHEKDSTERSPTFEMKKEKNPNCEKNGDSNLS